MAKWSAAGNVPGSPVILDDSYGGPAFDWGFRFVAFIYLNRKIKGQPRSKGLRSKAQLAKEKQIGINKQKPRHKNVCL